jgi:hypothetical protein
MPTERLLDDAVIEIERLRYVRTCSLCGADESREENRSQALKLRDAGKAIELIAHMLRILSVGDAISPDHIAEVAAIGKKLSK